MNTLKKSAYYKTSHKNSEFSYDHLSYANYILEMQKIILETRLDLSDKTSNIILEANSPAEHLPTTLPAENGILLVHGLRDSPAAMSSLYDYYRSKGYLVRSLLLPGHGTVPGDLLTVDLAAWIKAFKYAVASFQNSVKNFYVVGFSTGASLALYEAFLGLKAEGIILLAPAIRIKNLFAAVTQWHSYFSFLGEKSQWFIHLEETDYAKYQSMPLNCIAQLYQLTQKIALYNQKQLKIPLFMILSHDDETIDVHAAEKFFHQQHNPLNRLLIYSSQKKPRADSRIEMLPSYFPNDHILDFSHISLSISPEHPHYGKQGDFQDFTHYQFWWGKMFNYKRTLPVHYGSFNWNNLYNYHLARLTYNPEFYSMMEKIDRFIEQTAKK